MMRIKISLVKTAIGISNIFNEAWPNADMLKSAKKMSEPLQNNFAFVACKNDRVLGAIILQEVTCDTKPALFIGGIGVSPEIQSHGLGGMLLNQAKNRASAERKLCVLQVPSDNSRAMNFYIKHGFKNLTPNMNFNIPITGMLYDPLTS